MKFLITLVALISSSHAFAGALCMDADPSLAKIRDVAGQDPTESCSANIGAGVDKAAADSLPTDEALGYTSACAASYSKITAFYKEYTAKRNARCKTISDAMGSTCSGSAMHGQDTCFNNLADKMMQAKAAELELKALAEKARKELEAFESANKEALAAYKAAVGKIEAAKANKEIELNNSPVGGGSLPTVEQVAANATAVSAGGELKTGSVGGAATVASDGVNATDGKASSISEYSEKIPELVEQQEAARNAAGAAISAFANKVNEHQKQADLYQQKADQARAQAKNLSADNTSGLVQKPAATQSLKGSGNSAVGNGSAGDIGGGSNEYSNTGNQNTNAQPKAGTGNMMATAAGAASAATALKSPGGSSGNGDATTGNASQMANLSTQIAKKDNSASSATPGKADVLADASAKDAAQAGSANASSLGLGASLKERLNLARGLDPKTGQAITSSSGASRMPDAANGTSFANKNNPKADANGKMLSKDALINADVAAGGDLGGSGLSLSMSDVDSPFADMLGDLKGPNGVALTEEEKNALNLANNSYSGGGRRPTSEQEANVIQSIESGPLFGRVRSCLVRKLQGGNLMFGVR